MRAVITLIVALMASSAIQGCGPKRKDDEPREQTSEDKGSPTNTSDDEPGDGTDPSEPGGGGGNGTSSSGFPTGFYAGYLEVPSTGVKTAAEAYLYVAQSNELNSFPTLRFLLKLHLGGFASSEYVSEEYHDVLYSYEQHTITLDDPLRNIVFNGKAETIDNKKVITGPVWMRNSAVPGVLKLWFTAGDNGPSDEPGGGEPGGGGGTDPGEPGGGSDPGEPGGGGSHGGHHSRSLQGAGDDEPGDGDDPGEPGGGGGSGGGGGGSIDTTGFLPRLMGEYLGQCDGKDVVLQILTGRGLADESAIPSALVGYGIRGRLAMRDSGCVGGEFCVIRHYESGGYDFFKGDIVLRSDIADDHCTLSRGQMNCDVSIAATPERCDLKPTTSTINPLTMSRRSEHVGSTAAERQAVPDVTPPVRPEVVSALSGAFHGFLHNERLDAYQPFKLDVLATISSVNPHNNDVVYVSATATIKFDDGTSAAQYVQPLGRKSFYITQGFSLTDDETDGLLIVQEWKQGFIRGIWVSRAFGRVGTVELVKGRQPQLSTTARRAPDATGSYEGSANGIDWNLEIFTSTQGRQQDWDAMPFQGTFRDRDGLTRRKDIAKGSYDFYTGNVAWLSDEEDERLIAGTVSQGSLNLTWPESSIWGVRLQPGVGPSRFTRRP